MKYRFFPFLAALGLIASACSVKETRVGCQAPVQVHVRDFAVSQNEFPGTRAIQTVAGYDGIKAVTLAFYKPDGSLQCCDTQLRADATTYTTFGDFSLSLPYGIYTLIVIAYGGDSPLILTGLTDAAFDGDIVPETFIYTQNLMVADSRPVELDATLSRIISRLTVNSTDGRPANVDAIRVTFSAGGLGFDPTSGFASADAGFVSTGQVIAAEGDATHTLTNFFLSDDEQTLDLTIETLDGAQNVLCAKTIRNVPFRRNRVTTLTGALYSASATTTFSVDTDFLPEYPMTF